MKNIFYITVCVAILISSISCEKEDNPEIELQSVKPISVNSFSAICKVINTGESEIVDYGFTYSFGSDTYNDYGISGSNKISLGTKLTTDTFARTIIFSNSYYSGYTKCNVYAYITNKKGTLYSSPKSFNLLNPLVSKVEPSFGKVGDTISIKGSGFSDNSNVVEISGYNAIIISASSTLIKFRVPSISSSSSNIYVTLTTGGKQITATNNFTLMPNPTSFSPKTGTWGTSVTINGSGFYYCDIYFGDTYLENAYSSNYVYVNIPNSTIKREDKFYIVKNGYKIEVPGGSFKMNPLIINSYSPLKVSKGTYFQVTGQNFHPYYYNNFMIIGNYNVYATTSGSPYNFTIPSTLAAGSYPVKISNGIDTVLIPENIEITSPTLTTVTPSSGATGASVIINGSGFTGSNVVVKFGNYSAQILAMTETQINVKVPTGLTTGMYLITLTVNNYQIPGSLSFSIQ